MKEIKITEKCKICVGRHCYLLDSRKCKENHFERGTIEERRKTMKGKSI
jgi:hypothetical protein